MSSTRQIGFYKKANNVGIGNLVYIENNLGMNSCLGYFIASNWIFVIQDRVK